MSVSLQSIFLIFSLKPRELDTINFTVSLIAVVSFSLLLSSPQFPHYVSVLKWLLDHFLQRLKTEGQLERVFLNISVVQAQSHFVLKWKWTLSHLNNWSKQPWAKCRLSRTANSENTLTVFLRMVSAYSDNYESWRNVWTYFSIQEQVKPIWSTSDSCQSLCCMLLWHFYVKFV